MESSLCFTFERVQPPLRRLRRHLPSRGGIEGVQHKQAPLEGETGEAPPVAGKASRFRGSGAIGGPARDRESLCRDGVAVSVS